MNAQEEPVITENKYFLFSFEAGLACFFFF